MKAKIELEDGTVFNGFSCGAKRSSSGEVVFNTSMVGYPESLTDPSYRGQILTFTYPLVGNYGVHSLKEDEFGLPEKLESNEIHVSGVVLSEKPEDYHHWNAAESFDSWLKRNNVPGIWGIDTRALTKKLRKHGVMLGRIIVDDVPPFEDPNKRNLVSEVSIKEKKVLGNGDITICVVDCGCKYSILRNFLKRNVRVLFVPWDHDLGKEKFDGLFLSNGPGDPKMLDVTINNIKKVMDKPIFGICLGNQLLARAAGAETYKLQYGHRSHNQPCVDRETGRCYITSQNHGFAVREETLPDEFVSWFVNANDKTNEGIKHKTKPLFSFQAHPEARGGPEDTGWLFDEFLDTVRKWKR